MSQCARTGPGLAWGRRGRGGGDRAGFVGEIRLGRCECHLFFKGESSFLNLVEVKFFENWLGVDDVVGPKVLADL